MRSVIIRVMYLVEFTCLDDILARIKFLSETEKCIISEIITICKILLVKSNQCSRREILFFYSETENGDARR